MNPLSLVVTCVAGWEADGTFPPEITSTLLAVGDWLRVNGEAVYDTHNWTRPGEGYGRGARGLNIRFTVRGENLYAIILGNWPGAEANIASLPSSVGRIDTVTLLGSSDRLEHIQDADGLKVKLPETAPCKYAYVLKITGLKMNPPTWTDSGNPQK